MLEYTNHDPRLILLEFNFKSISFNDENVFYNKELNDILMPASKCNFIQWYKGKIGRINSPP